MPRMKRGMTTEGMRVRVLAARNVRVVETNRPRNHKRAQGRPGAHRTHGPRATKKHAAEPQVQAESSGLPCAMVLRLIRDLPGDHAWLPPSPVRRLKRLHELERLHRSARTTRLRRPRHVIRR